MKLDEEALARRILRPDRPRLDEARTALAGAHEPAAAWERLAGRGLLPAAWVEGPVFLPPQRGRAVSSRRGETRYPPSVQAALSLGSDPEGLTTAESLAREAAARLGHRGPARIAWRVVDRWSPTALRWKHQFYHRYCQLLSPPLYEVDAGAAASADRLAAALRGAGVVNGYVRGDHHMHELWRRAGEAELRLSDTWSQWEMFRPHVGRRFAEVPDPFASLLGIWATGYGVEALTGGHLVLVAPAITPS